jgi:hypothetical protein
MSNRGLPTVDCRFGEDFNNEVGLMVNVGGEESRFLGVVNRPSDLATEKLVFGRVGGVRLILVS